MLNIELFSGIQESDMLSLLRCLDIQTKNYKKNSAIIQFNSKISSIGIVLDGSVEVVREDISGDIVTVGKLKENGIFGEALVCANIEKSPISVIASSKCEILFIPYEKVIAPCQNACYFHKQLVKNILKVISRKNLDLNLQIDLLGKRTTKEKLLTYLRTQMAETGNNKFFIPLNRNELAEFLCVDRSAMSRELCSLRDEGIIKFNKNYFEMNENE